MNRRTLSHLLEELPLVRLRALARRHDMASEEAASVLVQLLTAHLTRPEVIARMLDEMDEETRGALDLLIASGGQMPSHRLQRDPLGGELRRLGAGAMERVRPWEQPISATEQLFYMGLIFEDFGMVGEFRGQVLFIPPEILELLSPVDAHPRRFQIEPLQGVPPGTRSATLDIVEDAFVVLSDLQRHNVYSVKGRYLPTEALHRINDRLTHPEPNEALMQERDTQRLALLMHLLRVLRLIEETVDGLLKPLMPRVRRWLQQPRAQRLLTLQRAWSDDPTWNDLWRVPSLRPERTGWRNDPQRTRAALVRWLGEVPPDAWINVGEWVRTIKLVDPDFQRPDGDYNSWYIRHVESGQLLHGWANWEQVEGALLVYLLHGPLFWLGIVDLGYLAPSDRRPFAFRLAAWGERWLGHEVELPPPPEPTPLIISEDGVVRVMPGTDDWVRLHLERLSIPVEGQTDAYRLDKTRLQEELAEGAEIEPVLRFLEHAGNGYLPEKVSERLRRWAGGYGRVSVGNYWVLEVDDPRLLRDLRRLPHLSQFFDRPLGPRTILIPSEHHEALIEALRSAGFPPRVEE